MQKIKMFLYMLFLPVFSFAAKIDVSKTTTALDSVVEVLTSGVLRSILILVFVVIGYMYIFNKGSIAKEWLIAILIGLFFVLSGSFLVGALI